MDERKTVLVTGASGGIGRPLCFHLAKRGMNLIVTARNENRLKELQNELLEYCPSISVIAKKMDYSEDASIQKFVAALTENSQTLNGIVLMPPQIPPTDSCFPPASAWQQMFHDAFIGPLRFLEACLPFVDSDKRGKIVIISGISSVQALSHYATANVLRTAWLGQAKAMAIALGPKKIHINTLSLGGVTTPKYQEHLKSKAEKNNRSIDEQMEQEVSNVPLRKYGSTDDIAHAIEGLLSNFSDHFTGHNFVCDGGFNRSY
jgi:3-oxoacyl-[acyl-carrier protein] reductase